MAETPGGQPGHSPAIVTDIERPSAATLAAWQAVRPATAYELLGKSGGLGFAIKPLRPGMRLCGPAITVRAHIGDTLIVLRSIEVAQAGDVLVVDAGDSEEACCWGGTSSLAAQLRGLAGFVCNGAVRDAAEIARLGFPVFARGSSVEGSAKAAPGQINHPIAIGRTPIAPGDLVLGDDDGVVVVPRAQIEPLLPRCLAFQEVGARRLEALRAGGSILDGAGYRERLRELGLE